MKQMYYTQSEIAKACNVSYSWLTWFKTKISIFLGDVKKISRAGGVTMNKRLYSRKQYMIIGLAVTMYKIHGTEIGEIKDLITDYILTNKNK